MKRFSPPDTDLKSVAKISAIRAGSIAPRSMNCESGLSGGTSAHCPSTSPYVSAGLPLIFKYTTESIRMVSRVIVSAPTDCTDLLYPRVLDCASVSDVIVCPVSFTSTLCSRRQG